MKRVSDWIRRHKESQHIALASIIIVGVSWLFIISFTDYGFGDFLKGSSHLYLVSAIIQGLGAILALLITVSLIASQLASASYTPRVIVQQLKNSWLWFAIFIYLLVIFLSVFFLRNADVWPQGVVRDVTDVIIILSIVALAYIVPYTIATLKGLRPGQIAARFVKDNDYDSLDELIRRVINDGRITVLFETLKRFGLQSQHRLLACNGSLAETGRTAQLLRNVGRHSCQRRNPDALKLIMECMTQLITYCSEPPHMWRAAADLLNEALKELYAYSDYWIGSQP